MGYSTLAQRHEAEVAELLGARLTAGSGSKYEKSDAQKLGGGTNWDLFIENKCTQAGSYRISPQVLDKLREEMYDRTASARAVLAVRIYKKEDRPVDYVEVVEDLAVISVHDLAELLDENQRLREELERLREELERV